MRSAGWCAYMQSQLEREERQREYERKRAEREAWKMEHMSSESCPLCGSTMYVREGKCGKFLVFAIILIAKTQENEVSG